MASDGQADESAEILAGAERILSEAFGGPVRLDEGEVLGGTVHRSRVLRRRVLARAVPDLLVRQSPP
jgi:hypothetical protein